MRSPRRSSKCRPIIRIKMRQRIYSRLGRILSCFLLLVVSLLTQNCPPSARLVSGNIVSAHNNSLPALSERANGVNSRYLSAASTASLAAATVAAANGNPQGTNSQVQEGNRNFLLHQQQQQQQLQQQQQQPQQQVQQQQQQQQVPVAALSQVNQSPPINQAAQPQQQASTVAQSPQFNSPQAQQLVGTPLMSTTFTFNPITGQFVPAEVSTGSFTLPPWSGNPGYNVNGPQVQQQQGPFSAYLNNNPYGQPYGQQQQRVSQGYAGGNQNQGYQQLSQQYNQQRPGNQFSRRNGYQSVASQSRPSSVYNQHQGQPIEDDSGFFQQQVTGSLVSSIGSEQNFGQDTNNGYLFGGNNQIPLVGQFNEHLVAPQPSSVAPAVALPTPSTTFSTSFSGPPPVQAPAEYRNDQCVAADNRHGTCYQASECIKRGGTPMGKCYGGPNNNEFSGSSYVCCLFDVTCGQFAAERFVYFRNPNYPNTYDQSRMCRAKIGKLDKGVCQFRLDLQRFDVAKPTNGNCSNDMFVVSGQNENYVIPKICGLNNGQHYYVGVDESGIITLHMMMMGYYRRSFEILITQIPCRSDYSAPAHCLQYYMGTHGTIKSFNYDDETLLSQSSVNYDLLQQSGQLDGTAISLNGAPTAPYGLQFNTGQLQQRQQLLQSGSNRYNTYTALPQDQFGGYPNDLDYTMCIRKESGFCSITYQLSRGDSGLQPFAVGHSLFGANESIQGSGWHPLSTECRDDYLLIGGVRLCSGQNSNQLSGYDSPASIQFGQNGSVLNLVGVNQQSSMALQQQLQSQYNILMQQLARIQQQQVAGNGSYATGGSANGSGNNLAAQQQQQQLGGNVNGNLEQQQAVIMQQVISIQQQLNSLANNNNNILAQNNKYSDAHSAIITDTTSGPFLLRFVSNMARNARGFHIDYRQNPCK